MTEVRMFGYEARLTLDLPGGPHDVTDCIEMFIPDPLTRADEVRDRTSFRINTERLLSEIAVENRTRERTST